MSQLTGAFRRLVHPYSSLTAWDGSGLILLGSDSEILLHIDTVAAPDEYDLDDSAAHIVEEYERRKLVEKSRLPLSILSSAYPTAAGGVGYDITKRIQTNQIIVIEGGIWKLVLLALGSVEVLRTKAAGGGEVVGEMVVQTGCKCMAYYSDAAMVHLTGYLLLGMVDGSIVLCRRKEGGKYSVPLAGLHDGFAIKTEPGLKEENPGMLRERNAPNNGKNDAATPAIKPRPWCPTALIRGAQAEAVAQIKVNLINTMESKDSSDRGPSCLLIMAAGNRGSLSHIYFSPEEPQSQSNPRFIPICEADHIQVAGTSMSPRNEMIAFGKSNTIHVRWIQQDHQPDAPMEIDSELELGKCSLDIPCFTTISGITWQNSPPATVGAPTPLYQLRIYTSTSTFYILSLYKTLDPLFNLPRLSLSLSADLSTPFYHLLAAHELYFKEPPSKHGLWKRASDEDPDPIAQWAVAQSTASFALYGCVPTFHGLYRWLAFQRGGGSFAIYNQEQKFVSFVMVERMSEEWAGREEMDDGHSEMEDADGADPVGHMIATVSYEESVKLLAADLDDKEKVLAAKPSHLFWDLLYRKTGEEMFVLVQEFIRLLSRKIARVTKRITKQGIDLHLALHPSRSLILKLRQMIIYLLEISKPYWMHTVNLADPVTHWIDTIAAQRDQISLGVNDYILSRMVARDGVEEEWMDASPINVIILKYLMSCQPMGDEAENVIPFKVMNTLPQEVRRDVEFALEDQVKESCKACLCDDSDDEVEKELEGGEIPFTSLFQSSCGNRHSWPRCGLSCVVLDTLGLDTCSLCGIKVGLFTEEDGPITRILADLKGSCFYCGSDMKISTLLLR